MQSTRVGRLKYLIRLRVVATFERAIRSIPIVHYLSRLDLQSRMLKEWVARFSPKRNSFFPPLAIELVMPSRFRWP